MSSIDNLFGNVLGSLEKTESAVSKLFSAENSRPVNRLELNKRVRTDDKVEPELEAEAEAESSPSSSSSYEDEDDNKASSTEDASSETKQEEKAARVIDTKDAELEKASRTLFVGNITTDVITSKPIYKEFKRLFTTDDLKVESIRFRSISFDEPLPRKVAFVKQKLHNLRNAVNAYVVYSKAESSSESESKTDSLLQNKLISKLNGTLFKGRHLRVDSVLHPAPHSNTRSIFIGSLEFEEDEESLWRHFSKCGAIEYVRIVRDPRTNIGKGFAYVQFKELEAVSKALLLDGKRMVSVHASNENDERWSRELRVTRCRNMKKDRTSSSGKSKSKSRLKLANLNQTQRTRLGRASKVLGKADRATVGMELTIEGTRAIKGENVANVLKKKHKKPRWKTGRVTKRSQAYKKAHGSK